MENIRLSIDGMSCDNCVKHVKKALAEIEGVEVLNVLIGSAIIVTKTEVDDSTLRNAVEEAGYSVVEISKG